MDKNNPTQNRPRSPKHAPDPATTYERAKPDKPALHPLHNGQQPEADPTDMNTGASNAQPGDHQINAHDDPNAAAKIQLHQPKASDKT